MHPVLGHHGRLLIYLVPWVPGGLLLAVLLARSGAHWPVALGLAIPSVLIYAFICLAAWYPSKSTPLRKANLWQVGVSHAFAALLSTGLWQAANLAWASLLARLPVFSDARTVFLEQLVLFLMLGVLLYILAAASSYLFLAFETSRQAEKVALEAQQQHELANQELELARALQHRLLPAAEHSGGGFVLAARNLAARGVAGDFYDYFELPDGTWRIAVADVAGKGMAASLIMATVKAILPLVAAERSLVETLDELNRRLCQDLAPREFVALAVAGFDAKTGRLELVNAGLPDPYVLTEDGTIEPMEVPQPRLPLGMMSRVRYCSIERTLSPGDRLLMLTDGLPEAATDPTGTPLGYEALESFLESASGPPGAWLDDLVRQVRAATEPSLSDDWTLLMLESRLG